MTTPTFQELLTSQEARFTNEQLEAWAGLGPWEWSENWLYVADYSKHPGPVLWYTTNDDGVHAKPDAAALIAAAPALAAALLAERKAWEVEVGDLKRTMFTVRVIAVDALFQPTFQRTALERISAELRAALEGPTP